MLVTDGQSTSAFAVPVPHAVMEGPWLCAVWKRLNRYVKRAPYPRISPFTTGKARERLMPGPMFNTRPTACAPFDVGSAKRNEPDIFLADLVTNAPSTEIFGCFQDLDRNTDLVFKPDFSFEDSFLTKEDRTDGKFLELLHGKAVFGKELHSAESTVIIIH